jgi:uncharacterized protein
VVVIAIAAVVCLLGVGLFKATRPQPVSIGGSSSPAPAPLATALNSPNPTPLVSPASPSPSPSGAELFAEAKRYLEAKDYAQALPRLQRAAEAGNADAMTALGRLYKDGNGVAQDYDKAGEWFQKAAAAAGKAAAEREANNPSPASQTVPSPAISNAEWLAEAQRYLDAKDYAKAFPLLQKAADAGDAVAMSNLGDLYCYGHGVTRDYAQARQWYQKAADAGNAYGMYNLGYLYQHGLGVGQDHAQAWYWYQKAADAGNAEAKQAL